MMKRIAFSNCRFGSKDSNSKTKRSSKNGSTKKLNSINSKKVPEDDHTYDPTDCSLSTVTGIVTEAPRSVASAPAVRTHNSPVSAPLTRRTSSKKTASTAKSSKTAAGDLATTTAMEESHASLEKLYEQASSTLTQVRAAITQYTAALEVSRENRTSKLERAQARYESGNRTGAVLSTRQVLKYQHESRQLEKALYVLSTQKSGLVRYARDCKVALRTNNTSAVPTLALQGKAYDKTIARAQKLVAQKATDNETSSLSDEALLEKLESMI